MDIMQIVAMLCQNSEDLLLKSRQHFTHKILNVQFKIVYLAQFSTNLNNLDLNTRSDLSD